MIGTCLLLYQWIGKNTEFSFKMCWTVLESLGCIRHLKLRTKSRIFLRCLQRCFNSNKQVNARGMFKCIWCSQKKKEVSPPPSPSLCRPTAEPKAACILASSLLTTVSLCRPALNLFNTDEHKIPAYFSLCKQAPTYKFERKAENSCIPLFFGMNRAFNINTEMEVISTIYWILKHLGMFSQTVYLIGWTCGHLILEKICWQRQRNSYLAASHTFSKDWSCFFCFKMMLL